ncbi:hypothetical protein [Massilia niabensis]|uniref:Collagen-like protein n=1 Tax=Massilia niabensis TaxID=544910 RepID=A0ABW0L4I5_9BURK
MNVRLWSILVGAVFACWVSSAIAQDNNLGTAENLGKAVPPDVLDAIKKATSVTTVFPVNPGEKFAGQVLKADEIVFAPGATLTLTNLKVPFIVIAAKRWKFADATITTKIERDPSVKGSNGMPGATGGNGLDGSGEVNRRGNDGVRGEAGKLGADGQELKMPHIYLVAGDLTSPKGEPLPGFLRLTLVALGIDGGAGGNGGKGGNGGRGAGGKKGATSGFDCKDGPGRGGTGGVAGQGGQGGKGGNGSDGAAITVIGPKPATELFSYARIFNDGGVGGRAGRPGAPGQVGRGGGAAPRNGWCGSGQPGDAGDYPDPLDQGTRGPGSDGAKGQTTLITVNNLSPIF